MSKDNKELIKRYHMIERQFEAWRAEISRMKPNIGGIRYSPNDKRRESIDRQKMKLIREQNNILDKLDESGIDHGITNH